MWNQKPLSSPGGSPKLGGQQQRSNPFASSRPLAGTAAAATATGHHRSDQPPPQHPGANTSQPATGPPPTAAYAPHVQGSVHAAGAPTPPTASPQRAFYPTPPEMHPRGGTGMGSMTGHEGGGYGAMGPMAGGGIPQPSQQQAYQSQQQAYRHQPHQPQQLMPSAAFVPAQYPNATVQPGLFTPQTADASLGPPQANAPPHPPPAPPPSPPFVPPTFGTPGSGGGPSFPSLGKPLISPSSSGVAGASAGWPIVGAPPISLRGREKYCSGGAWVGPAPEWPKPPADATIANADVSRVPPRHARIVTTLREKFEAAYAASAGAKKKELDGISTKIGGMFVFLNEGEGETHISGPVADSLAALCDAMRAGDASTVNAHLLHVSTHHWEEAAYWFPSLKRLVKL